MHAPEGIHPSYPSRNWNGTPDSLVHPCVHLEQPECADALTLNFLQARSMRACALRPGRIVLGCCALSKLCCARVA